jgi:hypothetical protein
MTKKQNSNKMWGGRFSEKPTDIMQQINVSIGIDRLRAVEKPSEGGAEGSTVGT